jgi:hypothetical protein
MSLSWIVPPLVCLLYLPHIVAAVSIASAVTREYGASELEQKKKSKALNARERVSLARRVLQQANGVAADGM